MRRLPDSRHDPLPDVAPSPVAPAAATPDVAAPDDPARRRALLASACVATTAGAVGAGTPRLARAQERFPVRTVRIVVPYSVGIGPDIVARAVGEWLQRKWQQSVIIDNKPGASGILAFADVRHTPPDGHTLYLTDTGTMAVNPLIHTTLPYDPVRDLVPVSLLFRATFLVLVGGGSRFQKVTDLLAAAREAPEKISYASLGNGHPSQVAVELLARAADVKLLHLPFREAGSLFGAVAAGDADFTAFGLNSVAGLVRGGKIRPLAVAARSRLREAPDIPTLVEAGGPPVEMRPWAGLAALAHTPEPVLEQLHRDVTDALAAPEVRARIEAAGFEVTPSTPAAMVATIDADVRAYTPLVREGRVRRDN
jgi:tripartite-type tricarboxylate transporter receptor subunit TctC